MTNLQNKFLTLIPDSYLAIEAHNKKLQYKYKYILSGNIYSDTAFDQEQESDITSLQNLKQKHFQKNIQVSQTEAIPQEIENEVGYLSVGVFTALGALPVENAVITVYTIDKNNEENIISHQVTDSSGRVPEIELPVIYNPLDPLETSQYFFKTYNLRVQALNYYTVNILDFRIFPNTTTNFSIEMIPVAIGPAEANPNMTFVIPTSPIDKSNN